jgi:hypothetical protein
MNAWLITWEGTRIHKSNLEKIVAILSSRKTEKTIVEFVELFYMRSMYTASNMAYYANRRRDMLFKAQRPPATNDLLYVSRIFCGSGELMLYARRVTNLKIRVDKEKEKEILTWAEPTTYKWEDGQLLEIKPESKDEIKHWERDYLAPLSKDIP